MKNNYKSEISIEKKYKKTKKGKQKINGGDPGPDLVHDPDLVPDHKPDPKPEPESEPDIKVGDHIEVTLYNFQRDYELTKQENGKKYYKKRGDKNSKYLYLLEYDFYDDNNPILVDLPGDDPNKEQRLDLGTDKVKKIKENLDLNSMKSALRVFMEHCNHTIIENGKKVNVCNNSVERLIYGDANLGTSQNPSQHHVTFGDDQIYTIPREETNSQDVKYVQQPQQQGPQVQYVQQPLQQPLQQGQQAQYVQQGPYQGQYVPQEDIGVGFFGLQQSILDNNYNTRQQPIVQSPQPHQPATYMAQPLQPLQSINMTQPPIAADLSLYTAPMPQPHQPETYMAQPLQPLQSINMTQPPIAADLSLYTAPMPQPHQPETYMAQPLQPLQSINMTQPPIAADLSLYTSPMPQLQTPQYRNVTYMGGGGKIKNKSKLLFRDLLNDPNSKYVKYMNTLYLKINNQLLSVNKLYEFINSKDVRVKKEVKSKK
jgi:hypothetical protein